VQREIGPVLDFLRDLRDETGAAVVFVQHTGHERSRMRGSSDLEAYWETKIILQGEEGSPLRRVRAEHREAEAFDGFGYQLAFDERTESVRLGISEKIATVERDLDGELIEEITREPGRPTDAVAQAVGGRKIDVTARLRRLEAEGRLRLLKGSRGANLWHPADDAPELFPAVGNSSEQQPPAPAAAAVPAPPLKGAPGTAASGAVPGAVPGSAEQHP